VLSQLLSKKSHLSVFALNAKCIRLAARLRIQDCDATDQWRD